MELGGFPHDKTGQGLKLNSHLHLIERFSTSRELAPISHVPARPALRYPLILLKKLSKMGNVRNHSSTDWAWVEIGKEA